MAPQPVRRVRSAPIPPDGAAARPVGVQPWTRPPTVPLGIRRSVSLPAQQLHSPPPRAGAAITAAVVARRGDRVPSPMAGRGDPLDDGAHTDQMFYWLTGVTKREFRYFYLQYCGPLTPIDQHYKLYWLLRWYKQYPRAREFSVMLGIRRHGQRVQYEVQRWSEWLAKAISNAELLAAWRQRFAPSNALPVPDALYHGRVTASVDTFPIYLCKPKDPVWQRFTYNGKYGANVLKVQMMVDNIGTPVWYSGPHIGTYSDIKLARLHTPADLRDNERLLADKAYCTSDMPHLVTPYKKQPMRRQKKGQPPPPPPPKLTRQQLAYNRVHRWYRATVEHAFAYVKRFRILGERYRGKLNCKERTGLAHLHNALAVIVNLCVYHNRCSQHRVHPPIPHVADSADLSDHARAQESDDGSGSSSSDSEMDVDNDTLTVVVRAGAGDAANSSEPEDAEAPARKRQCRQLWASDGPSRRQRARPDRSAEPAADALRARADYGQYEYKWDEEVGTGYRDEQFRRQQPVWAWSLVFGAWLAAVVTQRRRSGGVYVRMVDSGEREGIAAALLRPRVAPLP